MKSGEILPYSQQRQLEFEQKLMEKEMLLQRRIQEKEMRLQQRKQEKEMRLQRRIQEKEMRLQQRSLQRELKREMLKKKKRRRRRRPSKWTLYFKNTPNPYQRFFKPRHTKIHERIQQEIIELFIKKLL